MADVIPLKCWRPRPDVASEVAAAPYDTCSRAEAALEIAAHPLSFLRIDKSAALFDETVDEYDERVYERARSELDAWYAQGIMVPDDVANAESVGGLGEAEDRASAKGVVDAENTEDAEDAVHAIDAVHARETGKAEDRGEAADTECTADTGDVRVAGDAGSYFAYRLTQGDHKQTGIMAAASVDDYQTGVIKRHENTRAFKETDRVKHIQALEAHTGPVLLTYPSNQELTALIAAVVASEEPLYDFVAPDGVRHEYWRVSDKETENAIRELFAAIPTLYIADGHHRAAAAARVAEELSSKSKHYPESQYFLVLLVGSDEMQVLDYNRVVSDLAGSSPEELLAAIGEVMDVELSTEEPCRPTNRGEFGMYLAGNWYKLTLTEDERPTDAVESLDVAVLHDAILAPLLGIEDPRSNPRITYVGGIRGLKELAERADKTAGVAFALYPCSLDELFAVADADRLMPPKSTWFEPKPRSGLAIHKIFE